MNATTSLATYSHEVRMAYLRIFGEGSYDIPNIDRTIRELYTARVGVTDAARALRVERV